MREADDRYFDVPRSVHDFVMSFCGERPASWSWDAAQADGRKVSTTTRQVTLGWRLTSIRVFLPGRQVCLACRPGPNAKLGEFCGFWLACLSNSTEVSRSWDFRQDCGAMEQHARDVL